MIKTNQSPSIDHVATGKSNRDARAAKQLTLREVAAKMKISVVYLSDLERGRRNWSSDLDASYHTALSRLSR